MPSLIDDWFGITYGRRALHALFNSLSPQAGDYAGRFRPAYTAVWNYAQWHLFGDPSMAAAAPFGLLRILGFFAAIFILARWLRGEGARLGRPVLWLAPLAVLLTPRIAVDLARYGPGEPLMVTGLILGLAIVAKGTRMLARADSRKLSAVAGLLLCSGYAIYLFGVYSKEASICFVLFIPFFVKWLIDDALPRAARAPAARRRAAALLAAALAAPLVHVAAEVAVALSAGSRPYPTPPLSLGTKIFATGLTPLLGQPGVLGTFFWFVAVPASLASSIALVRRREPNGWRVVALLVTGWSMSAFELAQGATHSRYYIAWLTAVAAVGAAQLSVRDRKLQLCIAVAALALLPLPAHSAIASWIETERGGAAAVDLSAGVLNARCRLFLVNFDIERRLAMPRLLNFAHARDLTPCRAASTSAYALRWEDAPLPKALAPICRSSWAPVAAETDVRLYSCRALAPIHVPDQDGASGRPDIKVVELRVPTTQPPPSALFQPSDTRTLGTGLASAGTR